MGRWRTSLFLSRFAAHSFSPKTTHPFKPNFVFRPLIAPLHPNPSPTSLTPTSNFASFRDFSAFPNAASPIFDNYENEHKYAEELFLHHEDDQDLGNISVRAIFLCTRFYFFIIFMIRLFGYYARNLFDEMSLKT